MEVGVEAARWVVGKALGPAAGGVLEAWAASSELGTNIRALRMELLYAQAMLNNDRGRGHGREDIQNPALAELLQELRDLAYSADDALDEVDYFRIQDELDGTYHAADEHAGGCVRNHALNARHTVRGIGKMLGLSSSSSRSASRGDRGEPSEGTGGVSCGAWPCRGHGSPDDGEQEDEASRCMPCGRATRPQPTQPRLLLPTNQGGQEEQVPKGCMQKIASAASNTINILGKRLPCPCNSVSLPVQNDASSNMASNGRRLLCCGRPSRAPQTEHSIKVPKLKFDRVQMSTKIKEITEQLKPVCAKVSTILNLELLDSNRSIAQCIATSLDTMLSTKQGRIPVPTHSAARSRPVTTAELIEPKIYGRDDEINKIIYDITEGDYCDKDLTVLPIVGPGGIGKTTLTQAIYKKLQHHFEEKIWVCVSTTFSVYKLTQEIVDNIKGDKKDNPDKVIEEKLKSKKFLLVLDDMWSCSDDDWGRFIVPFTKGQTTGSIVLVTTRFPAVAQMVKTTKNWIDLKSIDSKAFKELFLAYVFGDKNSSDVHSGLLDIGFKIVEKLKGSPLAAKTVGRLLKKHLDLDHWNRVLESKEWESENGENDIMPALKLSYDYLPFHLQHCFSYCALFPEDYKFKAEELIHLWIGLDVLHSHGETRRVEDTGQNHLTELVNSGFFRKEEQQYGELTCYVIHDLLHELVLKISSHEFLSINSANAGSTQIPPSIRYLSVNIDDTSVKDKITFDTCQKGLSTLVKRLKVGSLRSFMLFGQYQGSFVKTVAGLLKAAKALRVIFLSFAGYNFEDLLNNFPYCVHLRYLGIQYYFNKNLPDIISRSFHLRVLDLRTCYGIPYSSMKDMCNLVKLQHFIAPDSNVHSSIREVGKLASLQELTKFVVKKESQGFELNQIGDLTELCGSLHIEGLEQIELMEEADGAKLIQKTHLRELILQWDSGPSNKDPTREEHVLERLKPSSNILKLRITGQCGMTCPSWLGVNSSVPNLELLQLDDVSWKTLPPIGELWMVDEQGKEYKSCIPSQSFNNLKRLELIKIPKLKKWIGNGPCELFSHLKVLIIRNCPELTELPFTHHTGCEPEHEDHMTWFPKLELIEIVACPNLSSLPCIPWSSAMCSVKIKQVGSTLECLNFKKNYRSEYHMEIEGKDALDSSFWRVLSFHNLSKLEALEVTRCPPLSLDNLQMLSSLKTLEISDISNAFLVPEGNGQVGYQFPVESIIIKHTSATGEALTHLLSYFPELHDMNIGWCEMLTGLSMVKQQKKTAALELPVTSSVIKVEKEAQIVPQEQQQCNTSGEKEIGAAASTSEGLLLLPPQLQNLKIRNCPNLVLCTHSLNDGKDSGQTQGGGGGLQGLCSLRSLKIRDCPRFLSSYSSPSSSSCSRFPTSLEDLTLENVDDTEIETTLPLSNLTSLTDLSVKGCGNLRGEGLRHLLTRGRLTKLTVKKTPIFLAICALPCEQEFQSSSSELRKLRTDDVAGVLAPPICTLLSSSLTELGFDGDKVVERFTKEQEDALQLLTSLEEIRFGECDKLQCLPAGLHGLPNLKRLSIYNCPAIRSLPKHGLPSSLQELEIDDCPAFQSLPKDCLPSSLQKLEIYHCPAIRSLPKVNDLPSSLQELDIRGSGNEELRRQCRKLIGIIPVVYTD